MMEGSKKRRWEAENKQQISQWRETLALKDALSSLIVRPFSDSTDLFAANILLETRSRAILLTFFSSEKP